MERLKVEINLLRVAKCLKLFLKYRPKTTQVHEIFTLNVFLVRVANI